MPDMEEPPRETGDNAFPVDLSREEYIAFNLLLAKNGGVLRFRRSQLAIFGLLLGFSVAMLLVEAIRFGTLDAVLILVVAFIVLAGGFLLFGMPAYVKYSAGKAYDQSVLGGHEYYGMVYVYPDRLEKVGGGVTSAVRFSENAAYFETGDMMVLLASGSRAIVLPARCLTAEDAETVRRAVLAGVAPMRQRLLGRLRPGAAHRLPPPPAARDEQDREWLALAVEYTPEEFLKMVSDTALRAYVRLLPLYSGVSVVSGVLFGLLSGIPAGLVTFVVIMLGLFLLNTAGVKARARRSLAVMPEDGLRIRLTLTDRGLVASGTRPGQETRLAWVSIQHAVDREDCVEFYNSRVFIRIPKRCIPDMEELRRVVDAHMGAAGKSGK